MSTSHRQVGIALRIVIPILILSGAGALFGVMKSKKRKPAVKERLEPVRQVAIKTLRPTTETVHLSGFAYIGSQTDIPISAEIRGKVVQVRDELEDGCQVSKDDVLVKLDGREIRDALDALKAERKRLALELKRIDVTKDSVEATLKLRERVEVLMKNEVTRLDKLATSGGSVSRATVEAAEQRLVGTQESVLASQRQLTLFPLERQALEASLEKVDAQISQNAIALERCSITAPITGRLKDVTVEFGQTVQPGQLLFRVVDDNDLAAQVDLPAADVLKWLPIVATKDSSWVKAASPIMADITWVDAPEKIPVVGTLLRISGVDGTTRTARMIFSIPNSKPRRIFEGMFCRVSVKGRQLTDVFRIPRRALTVDGRVPTIVDGRLSCKSATVIVHQGDDVLIAPNGDAKGIKSGDVVITSPIQSLPEGHRVERTSED